MSEEYFYGVTLSTSHPTERWDPKANEEFPRSNKLLIRSNKLLIRQALLGPHAEPDELNVVQVETMSLQDTIKIPLAILKFGEMMHARLDVEFPDAPVTFTLVQGSGPVQLIGLHVLNALEEESEDSDFIFEEEESESEDDEEGEPKGKKAEISNNAKAASSKNNAKK